MGKGRKAIHYLTDEKLTSYGWRCHPKIRNSAALHFCVRSLTSFLCIPRPILSKLYEEFAKMRKIGLKRHPPLWPWSGDLDTGMVSWKLYDKFEKMSKNGQNWPVYRPWWPWPWPSDLDISARTPLFLRCIHLPSFVEIRKWEGGQNPVTDGRTPYAGMEHLYICVAADKNDINPHFEAIYL